MGGLGLFSSLYFVVVGVGMIGFVDFDVVDDLNLYCQVLFGQNDVGWLKFEVVIECFQQVNLYVDFVFYVVCFDFLNVFEIFWDYDIVVDGMDNFLMCYFVNDVCVLFGKFNVYGLIFCFEGQVFVFWGKKGFCYCCFFVEFFLLGFVLFCVEGGVFGVFLGIIGFLQVNEMIKLIFGVGDLMFGWFLFFDVLKMSFCEFKLCKNLECLFCFDFLMIIEFIDYDVFCGIIFVVEVIDDIDVLFGQVQVWFFIGEKFQFVDVWI